MKAVLLVVTPILLFGFSLGGFVYGRQEFFHVLRPCFRLNIFGRFHFPHIYASG